MTKDKEHKSFNREDLNMGKGLGKLLDFWNVLSLIFIGTDKEEKSVKNRRFFSGIVELLVVVVGYMLLVNGDTQYVSGLVFALIVLAYHVVIEGLFKKNSIPKYYFSLQVVYEDFRQNEDEMDFIAGRAVLRSIVKGLTVLIVGMSVYVGWGFAIGVAFVPWAFFRFANGSRMPHDWLAGTLVDGVDDSIGIVKRNKVYSHVDVFLDSIFNNLSEKSVETQVSVNPRIEEQQALAEQTATTVNVSELIEEAETKVQRQLPTRKNKSISKTEAEKQEELNALAEKIGEAEEEIGFETEEEKPTEIPKTKRGPKVDVDGMF